MMGVETVGKVGADRLQLHIGFSGWDPWTRKRGNMRSLVSQGGSF